jgi:peptidoglycan-N-acetylmuramic acid deacetylase
MKKLLMCLTCVLLTALLLLPVDAAAGELHWYCVRTKANRQPPVPSGFDFIEDYDGYYIDHKHGDGDEEKVVYLTFDAGYENGNVAKILDILKATETPAAFFVLEHLITANPELAQRMVAEGHLVCNHTANHPNLARADKEKIHTEIERLEQVCRDAGVTTSPYFRPPEGTFSREMMECVHELGYKTVFWSFAYADWDNNKPIPAEKAMRQIFCNMHNGAVILLHPTYHTNVEILPRVIEQLKSEGYRFGTLDELCARA